MPRRLPPPPKPLPQGDDEYSRLPEYSRGIDEATTGPRDLAKFIGGKSKVGSDVPPYPNA